MVHIEENIKKFTDTWGSRDETEVTEEIYDCELAKDELRPNIEEELERMVDGIINLELDGMRVKYGIKKKREIKPHRVRKVTKKVKIPQGLGKRNPK